MKENVDHPSHYQAKNYECIDVMIDVFGEEAVKNFMVINAFKYIWRMNRKNGVEDAEKAVWYLNRYVKLEKGDDSDA